MTATQAELIRQTQRIVPLKPGIPLLLTGAALPLVGTRQVGPPRLLRRAFDHHIAAAHFFAGRQLHLRLTGWQTIELIDHLLDFAQVDDLAFLTGKGHGQLAIRQATVSRAVQFFQLAFDDQHLQVARRQVLLRQVSASGYQALVEVVIGDGFEKVVELRNAKAFVLKRLDQRVAFGRRQGIGTFELDTADSETACVLRSRGRHGRGLLAGQLFKFVKAATLLFQQTVLAVTDKVLHPGCISRNGSRKCRGGHDGER